MAWGEHKDKRTRAGEQRTAKPSCGKGKGEGSGQHDDDNKEGPRGRTIVEIPPRADGEPVDDGQKDEGDDTTDDVEP